MNNVRYLYLRHNDKTPHSCIAMSVDRSTNTLRFQVSTCHSQTSFNRARARSLSYGRLLVESHNLYLPSTSVSAHEINSLIMSAIVEGGSFTTKTKRAAQRWLNHQSSRPTLRMKAALVAPEFFEASV
jgi:hypothetical protein